MTGELNQQIQQLIADLVAEGTEIGLQVAAYVDGQLVVDTWAGLADVRSERPVDGDTLFTVWSTTKGFVATCIHLLAEEGRLDYDTPVAVYWPEFGCYGKDATTIRDVLAHRSGVPQMPAAVTPEMMCDWDAMCSAIASHEPLWEPGTKTGYHAWTIGWILGEVIRRVSGRTVAQFAQEELCRPLGITDFYLGIPDSVEERVAPLVQDAQHLAGALNPSHFAGLAMPPGVTTAEVVNRADMRRAAIPGGGGVMNARAIARHYALLAGHGELDGVRLLSPARVDQMRTVQTADKDMVLEGPIRKGMGYFLGGDPAQGGNVAMGPVGGEFGHPGNGGSLGFADPERTLAFGLTKNFMRAVPEGEPDTAALVASAIRTYLDEQGIAPR